MRNGQVEHASFAEAASTCPPFRSDRCNSISASAFMRLEFPDSVQLLGPVITTGSTGLLSAPRGLGKSLLALHIGYAVSAGKSLMPWGVGAGAVVAYLDGEMQGRTLQQRLRQIQKNDSKPATRESFGQNFHIISRSVSQDTIGSIDNEEDQRLIESLLPARCQLLIIDNLSAWTNSAREDGSSFAPVKRWLTHLRTKGIAVLLVHHTGKNGSSQRGTSIHEDLLDYSILLREDKAGKPNNGTRFVLEHTKLRELHPNFPTVCRYTFTTDPESDVLTHLYEDRDSGVVTEEDTTIITLLRRGMSGEAIAKQVGRSTSYVSRVKSALPDEIRAEIKQAQVTRNTTQKTAGGRA
jgi:hypothetical protein